MEERVAPPGKTGRTLAPGGGSPPGQGVAAVVSQNGKGADWIGAARWAKYRFYGLVESRMGS